MSNSPNSVDVAIKNFVDSVKSSYPTFMSLNWEKDKLLDNYNYILTEKAKERLDKLYTYISNGIPVLLEGETGTSKTLSSEIICKYIYEMKNQGNPDKKDTGESFIKFNLSAEVKINDLMQKFMGNKSSLSGLEIVDGPFLKAFKGGIPLILDEINLAPEEVLQCIEEALDSGEINMEISGIGNIHCKKKEGFCLIATQNPNRDNYMNKRQNLSKSFLSHFQIIKFPPFEIEELEEIAKKLFKSFNNNKEGNKNDNKFISDLISFHKAWTSQDERKEEIACFTIREIAATVKAYIDEGKKNPFQIIKVIYASRYQSDVKQKLLKFLGSFDSFKKDYEDNSGSKYKIPKTMKGFYENDILKDVLESSLFSLEKRRNIIIVGEFGIGKSHIAREIAKIFNSKNGKEESSFYHFICTEETKCSDLIGGQTPEGSEGKNIYMEWKDGFLTKAIEKGEIVIMDNLQEANSTITERLNGLLDIKYDEGKKKGEAKKFDIPENPLKNSIEIHKDFRIIGICDNQSINQMSPAFLNRFDIIILENQLKNISNEALINLLQIIINRREEKSTVDKKIDDDLDNFFQEEEEKKEEENVEILNEESFKYLAGKIIGKINGEENKDNNTLFSLSDISKLCHSIKIFLKNEEFKCIPEKNIIDFIYDLLFSEKDIKIKDNQIKGILLQKLKEKNSNYIFNNNESLENYLSIVYASFLIHSHLCIIGPPGVGKTTSAKYISELLENNFKFFPFHRNTKISELYGTLNLKEQTMEHYTGPLIESAQKGYIFIADEMNLSSIPTMKSIVPFLDSNINKNILVPGLDNPIDIHDNFFFIVCQNELDNLGRNSVPKILQKKLRNINYPEQTKEEIKNICKKKKIEGYGKSDELFSEADSELLGEFMREYNQIVDEYKLPLLKWSFRDIDKIIKRLSDNFREQKLEYYKNFKYYHFIYFYLMAPIPPDYFNKRYQNETLKDMIHSLFIEVFHLKEISDELMQSYFDKPKIDLENNIIMKGKIGVKFDNLKQMIEEDNMFEEELSNYYDDLFKLKLISQKEPILLMGPSSYKTYLAEYFIKTINSKQFKIINLNQKTTIEELLGGSHVLPPNSYMFFYDLLKDITNTQDNDQIDITNRMKNLKEAFKNDQYDRTKTEILNNLYKQMMDNFNNYNNIKKEEQVHLNNPDIIMKDKNSLPLLVFKPGSISLSILKEESIIFKNIHEVSTEIFERFNELFGTERILSLNEDIYGTFFNNPKKDDNEKMTNKSINLKDDLNIFIFATCPENSFQSLSESVVSRFSVICVGEHGLKEKENIIRKYSKKCQIITEENVKKRIEEFLKENSNIKKIKNLIDIFDEMNKNNNIDNINNNQELEKIYNNLNYVTHYIKLNNESSFYNGSSFLNNGESPLKKENNYLISKISNLKIFAPQKEKKGNDKIVFTPIFNEMLDLLHFGICTGTPIIFEGIPGQGKQKVINYISDLLNYDVENIVITNNFSVNDLSKKTVLESNDKGVFTIEVVDTKLNKMLSKSSNLSNEKAYVKEDEGKNVVNEKEKKEKPTLFVFHNIQKASADVLSKISEYFNKKTLGSNYFFIGIINIKETFIETKTYYNTYFYNSIYYIVKSTNIDTSFYKKYYDGKDINTSILTNYFNNNDKKEETIFTITDFKKYITLKKLSEFDGEFLEEIIFKNRLYINRINKENKISNNFNDQIKKYNLGINYINKTKIFGLELNKKVIKLDSEDILESFQKEKNTLFFEQQKCLIFLGLAVLSEFPCILQGPTGVGKSHLIKLFAKMLGKKLHIIDLNKDNDISLLTKRYVFKKYEKKEEDEIESIVNELLENKDDNKNLSLNVKIKKLCESKLEGTKKEKFEKLKGKYKFIHRFKYEKSRMLEAVEKGEWILLDGIEKASAAIIEKITLLCGEKKELNLYESGQKPIEPKKGFHLFMTYNPERTNHNDSISSMLLDKCLIYYLDSFINNEQALSQIINGFLVNSNYSTNADLLSQISSKISNIHHNIMEKLGKESEKISERTIINFCKNFCSFNEDISSFPNGVKNNFLYFYFPSSNKEIFNKIINDCIDEKGVDFISLSENFITKCKKSLDLLDILKQNILGKKNYKFNLGEFIFSCLNIPFIYLENMQEAINEVIRDADKNNYQEIYLPLKTFVKYLKEIFLLFKNRTIIMNDIKIREALEFPTVRKLLLFEKLYKNDLISWNCFDILYQNINIIDLFMNLYKNQNLEHLGLFFDQIISNIKYIEEIILIFPYSLFKETKFHLLNEIFSNVIKITAIKKVNFKIKIKDKEYHFKFVPNIQNEKEDINIILDLNLNDSDELIITKETKIFLSIFKKNIVDLLKEDKNDNIKLKRFCFMLIEKILNSQKMDKNVLQKICKEIMHKLNEDINSEIKYNFEIQMLFKTNNNIVINIWSILYIIGGFENYLTYFEKLLTKIEKEIFVMFFYIEKDTRNDRIESPDIFEEKLNVIINMSKDSLNILNTNSILLNLSNNENYIEDMNLNSIEEREKMKAQIKKEIDIIDLFIDNYKESNSFSIVVKPFQNYRNILEGKNNKIEKEISKIVISDFKKRIEKKINLGFYSSEKLKESIFDALKKKETFEELKELDQSIDNYLIRYNNKKIEETICVFSNIDFSENVLQENKQNEYVKLLEILLKYSKIKDILNDIFNNESNNPFEPLKKLNELVSPKYLDFYNSFLIHERDKKKIIETVSDFGDAMLVQEIIYNNLVQNLIKIKYLLNNLYRNDNSGKIDEIWCKNIEKKYNLCSNIYMPKFSDKSFLSLFIKYKKVKNEIKEYERGFLIDMNITQQKNPELLNQIFEALKEEYSLLNEIKEIKRLILQIGNILIKCFDFKVHCDQLPNLCQIINKFIDENKANENEKLKIDILGNFIKAKELYLNYKKDKELLFDDINQNEDRKQLFTQKYPSLHNYLNCNTIIYKALMSEPKIKNYKPSLNSIPLWLICLRNLANTKNIKIFFENIDNTTDRFEKEFEVKLQEKLKTNYNDNYWTLLICPNNFKFLENEYYENLYKYFNRLLHEITLFSQENQEELYTIIKDFIFGLFNIAYERGVEYVLSSQIPLFELSNTLFQKLNRYTDQKFERINNSESMRYLKSDLEKLSINRNESLKNLINELKTDLKNFEKEYNINYNKMLIASNYIKIKSKCDEYNNLIDTYKNNKRTNKEIEDFLQLKNNVIQPLINENIVNYLQQKYNLVDNGQVQKVTYISLEEYINKYIKIVPNKGIKYFESLDVDNIESTFKPLIEKTQEIYSMLQRLDKSNINKLNELRQFMKIIEKKMPLFIINSRIDFYLVEKIPINIGRSFQNILKKLAKILGFIQSILNDLELFEKDKDIPLLECMKKESNIYMPKELSQRIKKDNKKEIISIKSENNIIPFYANQNNRVVGPDKIKYDLGTLNLRDPEFQNIYFASIEDNVQLEIMKANEDVKIIKRNKIFIIQVKIKQKKKKN